VARDKAALGGARGWCLTGQRKGRHGQLWPERDGEQSDRLVNSAKACAHGGFWPWAWWAGFGAGLYCTVGWARYPFSFILSIFPIEFK
jgi:hypothetical protein